ncbi:VOC family protein [Thermopolyspora sp. NPDC052614]|uniref:VOC family protein n=1 Tax=Thermopolyspora sp. NPDC052614 TaxID=3155682 RepID=UPI00341E3617
MAHYSRIHKVVIDVPEGVHDEELTFWQEATGQTLTRSRRYPEYHGATLPGDAFGLLIQRLGTGSARVHLDIHTDDLQAEIARLEALGARRLRMVNDRWAVMEDPAGLPFCVIPQEPGTLNDQNAQRWED